MILSKFLLFHSKAPWFAIKAIIGELVGALRWWVLGRFSYINPSKKWGDTTHYDSKNPYYSK